MSEFRILQNLAHNANVIFDRTATASLAQGAAKLEVATTRGLITPGNQVLPMFGIALPNIERTTERTIAGSGASALDHAVNSLLNLGRRHGVDGISLGTDPNALGLLRVKGTGYYEGGGNILRELGHGDVEAGRAVAGRIDVAARRVMEFAG